MSLTKMDFHTHLLLKNVWFENVHKNGAATDIGSFSLTNLQAAQKLQ